MLQVYATQLKIQECGFDYEIICYGNDRSLKHLIKGLPRLLNGNLIYSKKRSKNKAKNLNKYPEIKEKNDVRNEKFQDFVNEKFTSRTKKFGSYDSLKKLAESYDCVLVGSDQLWLPAGLGRNFYNLNFVPDSVRKISYATSFGVSAVPFYQKKRTAKFLRRIDSLSVREESGAKIVKEIAGLDAKVVLDPTLLLTAEEWAKYIPEKKLVKEPYIFCYFLGNNPSQRQEALKLQKKTGYKIVTTPHLDEVVECDMNFGDEQLFEVGPAEFVNLIRNAEYVCTDSFHGSVFSILHHKKFLTFNRFAQGANSRNGRIDSLCNLLGLKERRFKSDIYKEIQKDIDYIRVDKKLEKLRENSLDFLEKSLKGES
jgi:hypothetical protein